MALRSRSRTVVPTSGPGRGPGSDSRTRHRPQPARVGPRRHHRTPSADTLRLRAEALFAPAPTDGRTGGNGPPGMDPAEKPEVFPAAGGLALPAADAPAVPAAPEPLGTGMAWRERLGPALRERMPLWLQSRCGLERRSVAALGVLLVVAVVFAAQHFWSGRTQQVPAPEVVRAAAPYGAPDARAAKRSAEPVATPGPRPAGGTGPPGAVVVVDVAGKVRRPGLLRLPAGSRVADALRAAGGVRPGTDTDGLNRARLLVDGEQIVVGGPAPAPGPDPAAAATGRTSAGTAPAGPVSLGTATVDQLDTLPGVGPVLAQHIIDYRSQHGGFRSVDELREVNGIGERRFADLRNLVRP
ncbi:helix-hairpin-helix domain-containing protein [Streptomyces sp. NPDC008222]|uniref:helix-hairpin-helix domain-containing protein n=1 Tax=Streptomyces sp. NPDC008222 TaxID=3364820 RepID=UPI0036E8493E